MNNNKESNQQMNNNKILTYDDILNYSAISSENITTINTYIDDGVTRTDIAVETPFGYKRVAEIIRPVSGENLAAILYVHWYEPAAATSNRFQFVNEAKEMAKKGAVCMCVETLWSDLDFFYKRSQKDDTQNSYQEIINLRRFLDILLSQPGIDADRVAYVGHDFGGMYGTLLGSIDNRLKHFVIMAATACFSDWYLYYPTLEGMERENFIQEMASIAPKENVTKLTPSPILFQFGLDDEHVPKEKAETLFNAAKQPKEVLWYKAGHGLNQAAEQDRKEWLYKRLMFS